MRNNSIVDMLTRSAKQGTFFFAIYSILDFFSKIIERIFDMLSQPVWDAYRKYTGKSGSTNEEDGYPSAEEMFATLDPATQLKFKLLAKTSKERGRIL